MPFGLVPDGTAQDDDRDEAEHDREQFVVFEYVSVLLHRPSISRRLT